VEGCEIIAGIAASLMDEAVQLIDELPRDWGGAAAALMPLR
jgi:hypothetical protein